MLLFFGVHSGCNDGDIRLVNGNIREEGRVEFCYNDEWGTVCDDDWGNNDAIVVCRQLGFLTTGVTVFFRAAFGQGTGPILLDKVDCFGTESRLADCPANSIGSHDCSHSEDAGVRCMSGMLKSFFFFLGVIIFECVNNGQLIMS